MVLELYIDLELDRILLLFKHWNYQNYN
jgi:hypothetical protein